MQKSERGVNLEQGEAITLLTVVDGGDTAGTNGTAVAILGERVAYVWILNITDADSAAGDTLDVYVDTLFGTATWINVAHFTQVLGNGADTLSYYTITVPTNMTTTDDTTSDCAAGVARGVVGSQFRGRYVIVDGGAHGENFSFTLTGYAI
jgi:hypothetical protein